MAPTIATVFFALGISGLFVLDRDPTSRTSKALWIPVIWVFLIGSRPVSMWLQTSIPVQSSADQYAEGSPVDALVWGIMLAAGMVVLANRAPRVRAILRANGPLLLYLAYCALSTLWSEYPLVALKRWSKAVGDLVMVLIVLSDPDWSSALKRLLTRTGFLLVPLSILFIKYYPALGRVYYDWSFTPQQIGVAVAKNQLGMVCLVIGLASVWRFLIAYRGRRGAYRTRRLIAHGANLAMVLWLLRTADSATSKSCFILIGALMVVTSLSRLGRKPGIVQLMAAAIVCGALVTLFFNPIGGLIESVGRDATLTGRTAIWGVVLKVAGSPIVGTGYESFWLGERLQRIWDMNAKINESHNGYLEVFLNLGWVGVILLTVMLVTGYRNVVAAFRRDPNAGILRLAYFVTVLVYNLTEAAFKELNPIWFFFLLAISVVPERKRFEQHTVGLQTSDHALVGSSYVAASTGVPSQPLTRSTLPIEH